jgi:hypothetical protein
MKKFLPLVVLILVSCATQFQPIGNEVVYQPPAGWEVSESQTKAVLADDSLSDVKSKEAIVYLNGMNQIMVSVMYSDTPFDSQKSFTKNKDKGTMVAQRDFGRENTVSFGFGKMLNIQNSPVTLDNYGVYYGLPNGSAVVGVTYIGMQNKESDFNDYRKTVESIKFR